MPYISAKFGILLRVKLFPSGAIQAAHRQARDYPAMSKLNSPVSVRKHSLTPVHEACHREAEYVIKSAEKVRNDARHHNVILRYV